MLDGGATEKFVAGKKKYWKIAVGQEPECEY